MTVGVEEQAATGERATPGATIGGTARQLGPYVDGLSFVERGGELARAGLTAAICDVSMYGYGVFDDEATPGHSPLRSFEGAIRAIKQAAEDLGHEPSAFVARRGSDLATAQESGRTAVVLQFQGADPIGDQLHRIALFHALGLRVLQLTHHDDNPLAGGCMSPTPSGLTELGRQALPLLEQTGVLIDLAHASDPTTLDVLAAATRPVIVSHTGPRALVPNIRCAPDEVIRGVAESGGVVGLFMLSFWVTSEREPTVDAFVRSVRHLVDVGGIDAVGIANDFPCAGERRVQATGNDGALESYLPWWREMRGRGLLGFEADPPHVAFPGLNNIDRMERIHDALLASGLRSTDAAKVMGGNWLRVLTDVLG